MMKIVVGVCFLALSVVSAFVGPRNGSTSRYVQQKLSDTTVADAQAIRDLLALCSLDVALTLTSC